MKHATELFFTQQDIVGQWVENTLERDPDRTLETSTWFLTKKLMEVAGPVGTREILLLGEPMPARWMADHGVICRAVPENQLNAEAQKIIDRLATNAPLSLRAMKALIVRELAFRDGIAHADIDTMVGATRGSNDAKEGIAARLEKRPPVFTGS